MNTTKIVINERIKELMEQAGIYENQYTAEKFAELIVKECANIADKAEPYKANDLIRKHFGVEE